MNKQVYKAAKKFIKAVKGKKDSISAERFVESIGYKIVFYNTPQGNAEIQRYNLEQKAKISKGFVYSGTVKIIFMDNSVHADDKLYILLHEIGHILLGHVGDGKTFLRNAVLIDIEADAFVAEVLTPTSNRIIPLILMCITLLTAICLFNSSFTSVHTSSENTVYITKSGERYHEEKCISTNDSKTAQISKYEASKLFTPCNLCNPK